METYKLLTDDLVKLTLKNDKGQDVKLLSFESKPLVCKGDNYVSVVVSLQVRYLKDGSEYEESYVAKLNKPRPSNSFAEAFEEMFGRETDVLSTIIGGMNMKLEELKFPPIKTPKLHARNLEKGREIFIDENLRTQGFKQCDFNEGLDLNHTQLVLKELGRFHASSLLYEETLYPKTIPESFEYFKDPLLDYNHGAYQMLSAVTNSQVEGVYKYLKKNGSEYEKSVKWLEKNLNMITEYFVDGFSSHQPFDIFVHGDCYANNILFKYDDNNLPVDMRFVDLQCSRKASPASDLNYFFYTSINGELRLKKMDYMLRIYFDSFSKVLKKAGKSPPFSFEELGQEVKDKKFFGLSVALLIIPAMMVKSIDLLDVDESQEEQKDNATEEQSKTVEEMIERGGPLKDRLLSIFEELIESNSFD